MNQFAAKKNSTKKIKKLTPKLTLSKKNIKPRQNPKNKKLQSKLNAMK